MNRMAARHSKTMLLVLRIIALAVQLQVSLAALRSVKIHSDATGYAGYAHYPLKPLCCGWRSYDPVGQADYKQAVQFGEKQYKFDIILRQQNINELKKKVLEVSDPRSVHYGNHLTRDQINSLVQPSSEDVQVVLDWLLAHGIDRERINIKNERIAVYSSVEEVEYLFQTKASILVNLDTKQEVLRVGDYFLPQQVDAAVSAIFGLHGLPLPPRAIKSGDDISNPVPVTPQVIWDTYKIKDVGVRDDSMIIQAVPEFQGQYEKDTDLEEFFERYVPNAKKGDEKIWKFMGDPDKQIGGIEASLDIQYIMGVAPHIKTEFWMYANFDFCGDLRVWTQELLDYDEVPLVHSVSYGWQGDLTQVHCDPEKVAVIDTNFAKLAARGITIIFSSGDSGSGYVAHTECYRNSPYVDQEFEGEAIRSVPAYSESQCCNFAESNGKSWTYSRGWEGNPIRNNCTYYSKVTGRRPANGVISGGWPLPIPKLYPSWPASSPYVTSVGGTRFLGQEIGNEEMATDQFGSGGGFSDMFLREPDATWQNDFVKTFLDIADGEENDLYPPDGSFNREGRATPDVSALGEGYQVVVNGRIVTIGGTSASAPAFAAMISLINEARAQKGIKPLGYLNPFLYQNPQAFNDIVKGDNAIGRGTGSVPYGFNCTKGWDPVTGLGTPIFPKLLEAAMEAGNLGLEERY